MKRILVCLLLFGLIPVCSAEVTVGVDYASIGEALMSVEAGESIIVPEGVYEGGFVIDKPVSLIGSGAVLLANGSMFTLRIEADDVLVRGFTFAPSYTGVEVSGSGVVLEECSFFENMIGVDGLGDSLSITGCVFDGCIYAGVRVMGLDDVILVDNGFNNCLKGALFSSSLECGFTGNSVLGCDDGVFLEGVVNGSFAGNVFSGCNASFVVKESLGNRFVDNVVTGGVFLDLEGCFGNFVDGNDVEGVYLSQRYSDGNMCLFNGITLTGDMFSVMVSDSVPAGYLSIGEPLNISLIPDPVRGGAWAYLNISASLDADGVLVPGTVGIYRLDDMVRVATLNIQGDIVEGGYYLEESGVFGCLMKIDSTPPTPAMDAPTQVFTGDVFYLDATGSTDDVEITRYSWDLGDGGTESGVLTQHYYDVGGEYVISLRVVDAAGHEGVVYQNITVIEAESVPADGEGYQFTWLIALGVVVILGYLGFTYLKSREYAF